MRGRASAVLVLGLLCLSAPASAQELEQRIGAGQGVAAGPKVLAAGHVDVGPRFVDGKWTLMIHDDAAKADGSRRSVWRHTDQTVLSVTDDALQQVPYDPAYAFLHADPGADVHVVPQTQDPDVVWLGWNTQDPEVMQSIDRGVTLTLTGIQGPGSLVVYLQSGNFGEPQVLWDSTGAAEPVWVDVNTHTHANWVFSAPGVYLARVEISADLVDGSTIKDTRELRFAVGSGTSADAAFAAAWRGAPAAAAAPPGEPEDDQPAATTIVVIAIVAIGLAVALALVVRRGNRAKRRARA